MPRKSRIDAAGAVHHVMVRGIDQGDDRILRAVGYCEVPGDGKGSRRSEKNKVYQRNDEGILGDGDFVERVLASAEEVIEKRYALRSAGSDLERIALRVSEVLGGRPEEVR